ncbi:hypothetical protein [Alloscardovia criceti]|uniref:hypothetical protein n=1 Tax=Alloscardovia criceti TaxID=356828 RepID=UPI0003803429|nr:hypothetical protein [Alloscardovia criceti]
MAKTNPMKDMASKVDALYDIRFKLSPSDVGVKSFDIVAQTLQHSDEELIHSLQALGATELTIQELTLFIQEDLRTVRWEDYFFDEDGNLM